MRSPSWAASYSASTQAWSSGSARMGTWSRVVGLNEDGAALIEGIDFAGLSLENATIVVVDRLIEQGYINASMVDDVFISVTGSTQPDTLAMMSTIIKTAASQYELVVDTAQTGENELQVVMGDVDEPGSTPEPTAIDESFVHPTRDRFARR